MVYPVKRKVIVHHHAHDELRRRDSTNILRLMQAVPGLERGGPAQLDSF